MHQNDKFPKHLCIDCFSQLEDAKNLKKRAVESHFKFDLEVIVQKQNPQATPDRDFCNFCQKLVADNKYFHSLLHKEKKDKAPIRCQHCPEKFYFSEDLLHHACSSITKFCKECQLEFSQRNEMLKHLSANHFVDGVYKCPEEQCNTKEKKVEYAYSHIQWHHNPGEKEFFP